MVHEISTDELSGYKRKPHRSKNRLYDYFIAKVQNVDKKRHQHRWEKATKPFANEILQKAVGWRPFKEFNGGEDGEPGRVGVQFNFHSDGSKDAQFTVKDRPVALLYESEKPALKLTAPERQAMMPTLTSNQAETSGQYERQSTAALTYPNAEKDETEAYSSFYTDNSYIQDYMAEQHADLCSNIDKLGKEDKENNKDKKTQEKPIKPQASEATAELATTPKPVVFSRLAQATASKSGWSQAHDNFLGNPQTASALLGPRAPIQVSPDFLNSLIPVAKHKVSVMDLPGLMWNGLTESGKDLFDGVISLAEFTGQEALHLVKGEDLVTVQAAALLKEFIGEEAARYAMGENLKSAVMAKALVRRFQKLSHEERIQGGVKLYLSIVVEPFAAFKGLLAARKAGKQITQVAKEAVKSGVSEPVRFAPVSKTPALADLSKTGQNLEQLAPKLHDVSKVRVLNSAPEPVQFAPTLEKNLKTIIKLPTSVSNTFAPQYRSLQGANWKQAFRNAQELADAPFAPGSIGAAKAWSIKGRLKAAELPAEGKIRYIPPKGYASSQNLPSVKIKGCDDKCYRDRFDNIWKPGPSRTPGQRFEWDVQLSESGKKQFKWLIGNKNHLNISLDGRITHK